jgi:NADH:ubiquinone oxidoreductase subunit F (NADH-binding)/(2Fe-2S) ferredoxin/NAD-dependent dihydropyrimidine dehydrogenase PreA subunit
LEEEIKLQGLAERVQVKKTGCHGFCEQGPIIVVEPEKIFYCQTKESDIKEIVESHLVGGKPVERLFYISPTTGKSIPKYDDIPFYSRQHRVIYRNCGHIDPENIDDYIAKGGYKGLRKALLEMTPDEIIKEVMDSGLRGRGGAGFPTGRKWKFTRDAAGDQKYVICNGDEGDPGAYMDRGLLEGDPHSVLEGMIIGAYAIGANEGFAYVRDEYPIALRTLGKAIEHAKQRGFLGKNILGSDFDFDVSIVRGAGAFVCGEETALIASIEGKKGEPKQRPPFPAQKGLWGKPTNINNVKTWANIPLIIIEGAKWFSKVGTEKSKGTKIFSLVGKINNTGLVEVPMGITLRELIYEIGGGIPGGKSFKAIQTGGPSGGCIPESLLDTPIDYERLSEVGSIMGSGGMVVMDEDTCMVDVARFFLEFLQDESCGKCLSCREGLKQMTKIVTRITNGQGRMEDLELLEELAVVVKDTSMCGLGQTATNPVLSTLRYFRDEYVEHIKNKKCPAGVCRALIQYSIIPDNCTGCGACLKACPQEAISGEIKELHVIDQNKCIKCGICLETCRFDAIEKR